MNLASAREPFYEKVPVNFSKLPVNIKIMSGRRKKRARFFTVLKSALDCF